MKIQVNRVDFIVALKRADNAVNQRSLPITNCALITTGEPELIRIVCTDLDCYGTTHVGARCDVAGSAIIPVARALSVLACMSSAEVNISYADCKVTIGSAVLNSYKVDEFPKLPALNEWQIAQADLGAITKVMPFTPKDNTRPELGAVFIEPEGDGLVLAASNGRVVAIVKIKGAHEGFERISVPTKMADLVSAIGPCVVHESQNFYSFTTDSVQYIVKKLSIEKVVPWRNIPNGQKIVNEFCVMREDFEPAIQSCHALRERSPAPGVSEHAKILFHIVDGDFAVETTTQHGSYSTSILGARGQQAPIILPSDDLISFLRVHSDDVIKFGVTEGSNLARLSCEDSQLYMCGIREHLGGKQ